MGEKVKIVNLCSECDKCPTVEISETSVKIGEEGNMCILSMEDWVTLKGKILDGEL